MAVGLLNDSESRQCKPQRRSRYGCRNCKLRKLKCDEAKPHCKKCRSFGVLCNLMSNIPDLQSITPGTERSMAVRGKTRIQPALTSAVWTSDRDSTYQLTVKCQDFITRYLGRSLMSLVTPDDPNMVYVNHRLLDLAFAYPFLMHASLAVAYTYDCHQNNSKQPHRSLEACYHWSKSTTLLNKRLRQPIKPQDRDPIWGTAAALAILSFASPDADTPQESWPLRSSETTDFNWLHMSKGKNSLWHIVNPLRPDSIFHVMSEAFAQMFAPLPERGRNGIPDALASICDLEDSSTARTNAYFYAAHAVARILDLPDSEVSTGNTQIFTLSIQGEFERLLRDKDPVALLLLYLWYSKAGRSIWWIGLRARVECPSIYSYLRLYHRGNAELQDFLPWGSFTTYTGCENSPET